MKARLWLLAGALLFVLAPLAPAGRPKPPPPPPAPGVESSDPPGTTLYMDQLRALFAAWDLNGDDSLDKAELAQAFRGADAKPYDYKKTSDPSEPEPAANPKTTKKPDHSDYPDYNFLVRLDQDGDGQISRAEFMDWARDYAVQIKQQTDEEAKLAALEAKLAAATTPKEIKAAERALKKQKALLSKMQSGVSKEIKAFDKAMQQHLKHHK